MKYCLTFDEYEVNKKITLKSFGTANLLLHRKRVSDLLEGKLIKGKCEIDREKTFEIGAEFP